MWSAKSLLQIQPGNLPDFLHLSSTRVAIAATLNAIYCPIPFCCKTTNAANPKIGPLAQSRLPVAGRRRERLLLELALNPTTTQETAHWKQCVDAQRVFSAVVPAVAAPSGVTRVHSQGHSRSGLSYCVVRPGRVWKCSTEITYSANYGANSRIRLTSADGFDASQTDPSEPFGPRPWNDSFGARLCENA